MDRKLKQLIPAPQSYKRVLHKLTFSHHSHVDFRRQSGTGEDVTFNPGDVVCVQQKVP